MAEPCSGDCDSQRYPTFPYGEGADSFFSTALPIILSATVVLISWLAGRFIDKIEVSAPGYLSRAKSGTLGQSVKRSASHDKSDSHSHGFHSTASRGMGRSGVKMLEGVQELDGISAQDDEQNRLYHEEYGSQASQEDGDRYDALGDSPGAQGPSSQGPRSPSVYSHFSQSVFSQSAYGPSAYGPSQRRAGGPGSQYGHSQYGTDGSSLAGSHYPGPVPSHFGASQMSSERTSYHASNGGGSSGPRSSGGVGIGAPNVGVNGGTGAAFGRQTNGDGRGGAADGGAARMLPPPSYNPNALHANRATAAATGAIGVSPGLGLGSAYGSGGLAGSGGGSAAMAAAAASAAMTATVVAHDASGFNRGSPPPYSQAASTLPKEPRPSVDSRPSLDAQQQARVSLDGRERRPAPSSAAHADAASAARAGGGGGAPGGPSSGFGGTDSEPNSEIPSTFRA